MQKIIFLLSFFCFSNITQAYIYELDIWSKDGKFYFLLSDWHIAQAPFNLIANRQRCDLIKWAKKLDASVIVEDMHPMHYDDVCKNFEIKNFEPFINMTAYVKKTRPSLLRFLSQCYSDTATPIRRLSHLLHYANIDFNNIEFRFGSDYAFPSVKFSDVLKVNDLIIKEIESYNDGHLINQIYKKELDEYKKFEEKYKTIFYVLRNSDISLDQISSYLLIKDKVLTEEFVKEFISFIRETVHHNIDLPVSFENDPDKIWPIINKFFMLFNLTLIDLRILHSMHTIKGNNVIIAAGGQHIANVNKVLNLCGFKKIHATRDTNWIESYKWFHISEDESIVSFDKREPSAIDLDKIFLEQCNKLNIKIADNTDTLFYLNSLFRVKNFVVNSTLMKTTRKYLTIGNIASIYCIAMLSKNLLKKALY